MRAALPILALLLVAPSAMAGDVLDGCHGDAACISETTSGDPSCQGEWHSGWTAVEVDGVASAYGFRECGTLADGRPAHFDGILIYAGPAVIMWIGFGVGDVESCFVAVVPVLVPCATPPPPLPWGSVLP